MSENFKTGAISAASTAAVFLLFLGFYQLQAVFVGTNQRIDALIQEANVKLTNMDKRIKAIEAKPATPPAPEPKK